MCDSQWCYPSHRAMVQSAEATRWPEVWQTRSRSSSSRCTTGGGPTSPRARRRGASPARSPAPATWSTWWVICYLLQLKCSCFDVGRRVGEDCTETRWPVQLWPWLQRLQENIPVCIHSSKYRVCIFRHFIVSSVRFAVGQNLYIYRMMNRAPNNDWTRAITDWYDEVTLYSKEDVDRWKYHSETGHYTQVKRTFCTSNIQVICDPNIMIKLWMGIEG